MSYLGRPPSSPPSGGRGGQKNNSSQLAFYRLRTPTITHCIYQHSLAAIEYPLSVSDDTIVVSALAAPPFCCHADLLTMGAKQLIAVVTMLNDALPPPLRINVEAGCQYLR
ncbi:hypothetical protein F5148DRAFT_1247530 [Russula earlei]|uniref:Uncharacterized protein n=1 Tax=Russula earlei TaxID=71964 RepID=A0ACC0TVF7_9AGAM|nr:hypothetical protein F5148DRAFT_1247530 [Russula earlei]